MVTTIPIYEALKRKNAIFIDTRTPNEFAEDRLPGAINIPIFSNEERAIVGTMYKQISKEKAIEKGIELFSQKLPEFMKEVHQYKDREIIVYCWRGGMRSKTVVSLLDGLSYNVKQLIGGHKHYRAYVRERLDKFQLKPKLIVLWGLTCTGKTALLQHFPNALDLEGLAQHRGSLYGRIGLQPRSQKCFENLLLHRLDALQQEDWIIVEGESRKIGDVQIPEFLYKAMLKGTHALITRSQDKRAEHAVKEYFTSPGHIQQIREITLSLQKVISKEQKLKVLSSLDAGDYQEAAKILLEQYYDPLYSHTLKRLHVALIVNNDEERQAVQELQKLIKQ